MKHEKNSAALAEWAAEQERNRALDKDEFVRRFVARMVTRAGPKFDDGSSIADYARTTAVSYWQDIDQRREGPEECADSDVSYWGD